MIVAAVAAVAVAAHPPRKKVYALSARDLGRYAVWEFLTSEAPGIDEATVEARPRLRAVDARDAVYAVRATFLAADGHRYVGYFSPMEQGGLGYTQPSVVVGTKQVDFWFGIRRPSRAVVARAYRLLGTRKLFPLQYRADVAVRNAPRQGVIRAFRWLRGSVR